jgi:hypothetical protein
MNLGVTEGTGENHLVKTLSLCLRVFVVVKRMTIAS